jgi:hypothetical protein
VSAFPQPKRSAQTAKAKPKDGEASIGDTKGKAVGMLSAGGAKH